MSTSGNSESLRQRVRRIRLLNGLTQGQLAARMRVTQARVSQIESGGSAGPLPLRTLYDLADGLGVDLADLVAGDPLYEFIDMEDVGLPSSPVLALPLSASPFIGRATEIAAIRTAIRDDAIPLLSLVGPAGVGKTQLALHAAEALQGDISDQVVVPLATCVDVASVLTTIARMVGLQERDERPLRQRLVATLRDRRMLLLLDNVEQALPAVSTLASEFVLACPRLRLLVTSRAPLNVRGELAYSVRPLGLPDPGAAATFAAAAASPAVQLFVHHAKAAVHGLSLTEANAASITAICRRLDGLPLAIELAAPRTRVMTLDQLLRQLDRRLTLLTSGPRILPARQQSLRANIAWSFDLLTPDQQALLRRLAVFVDGFTLEAAIEVAGDAHRQRATAGASAISKASAAVANGIALLLEQSLLTRTEQADGVPRFGILETIHEFAREQLEAADEVEEYGRRHLGWCLSLAEESVPKMFTADEPTWLARLQQEDANLQAALGFAFALAQDDDLEAGLRLTGALADYWFLSGLLSEGRAWLTRAIALCMGRAPSLGHARSLVAAALIEQTQAAVEPAKVHVEHGFSMARELDDPATVGRALLLLGNLAIMGDDHPRARSLHAEALSCFRGLGDQSWIALALLDLGFDCYRYGDLDQAAVYAHDALALARDVGDRWDTLNALYLLGEVARLRGDLEQAHALFAERVDLSWQYGSERDVADSLSGIGAVAVAAGDCERAARLLGVAETLYRRLEIITPPPLRPDWNAIVEEIQGIIDARVFAHLWTSTTPEQAMLEIKGLRQPTLGY